MRAGREQEWNLLCEQFPISQPIPQRLQRCWQEVGAAWSPWGIGPSSSLLEAQGEAVGWLVNWPLPGGEKEGAGKQEAFPCVQDCGLV